MSKYKRKYQKLRDSARGEDCTLQIHPYCNGNPETTILCHIPSGAGWGQKSPDWWAAYGCSDCHDIIDYRTIKDDISIVTISECSHRGIFRTLDRMIEKGHIKI
jgi:hypothetical protein